MINSFTYIIRFKFIISVLNNYSYYGREINIFIFMYARFYPNFLIPLHKTLLIKLIPFYEPMKHFNYTFWYFLIPFSDVMNGQLSLTFEIFDYWFNNFLAFSISKKKTEKERSPSYLEKATRGGSTMPKKWKIKNEVPYCH